MDNIMTDEDVIISVSNDDGTQRDMILIAVFSIRDREYCALLPQEESDDGTYTLELFRCKTTEGEENDEIEIGNIESDMEFDEAREELERLINEEIEEDGGGEETNE